VGTADHRATYEDLLRRYTRPLQRLAWSYEHDPSGREDLFQEIAMALWTALPRFRGDSSERTWVYRVAHNTAISFAASRQRRHDRERTNDLAREPSSSPQQEGAAISRQQRDLLWSAVQELPIAERQIIVLHLEGLSAAEIHTITGVSAGAIATRLTRIRQKLAAQFRDEEAAAQEKRP
jgi:RNA polymerase sigma-70 factor, ECF subfamily